MRNLKIIVATLLLLPFLNACQKTSDFNVNADWKDITIVYGLLSQKDSIHYIKITKAFLGPDNALYAKIPDSSNYPPGELSVRFDEYESANHYLRSYDLDTVTIHTKEPGDSIFYFPDQLVYQSTAVLNQKYIYKLVIHNNKTQKDIYSSTTLVNDFAISVPDPYATNEKVQFVTGQNSNVAWTSAVGGKRYQLVIRFHYSERPNTGAPWVADSLDWLVFSNVQSRSTTGGEEMEKIFAGSGFFSVVGSKIRNKPGFQPGYIRYPGTVDYLFSVASDDLNTYMEVTEPSSSIVQYRPPYTNITNGIGLFSSRFINTVMGRNLTDDTKSELKTNPNTADLGF
jgi:hypothetical protein